MFTEIHLRTKDNLSLYSCRNEVEDPKAQFLILHGYTEHCRRYDQIAEAINEVGINVIRYDHRGYGRSEGKRAYINSFGQYTDDLKWLIHNHIDPDLPLYIGSWSMGGLILASYIIEEGNQDLAGCIFCSSALKINEDLSPFLQKISGILSKITPWLKLVKLDSSALSRDPHVVEEYLNDPLVYKKGIYARTGGEMLKQTRAVQDKFHKISCPLLILHGTADQLTDPAGSQKLYDEASSTDKTIKLYDGWFHELFKEPEKGEVFELLKNWLKNEERLLNASGGPYMVNEK